MNLDGITFTPENLEEYKHQIVKYVNQYPKNNKGQFQWQAIESIFNDNQLKSLTGKKWDRNSIRNFYNKNKIKGEKPMEDVKEEVKADTKAPKKDKKEDKKEVKTDKKETKAPKKETKKMKMKKVSKAEMVKIIDSISETPMTASLLKGKFHLSLVMANKIKKILTNTQWKKVNEDTPLPQGYMSPKNLEQTIFSCMYDKGFTE